MANDAKTVARRFREEFVTSASTDLANELLAPDCVLHGPDLIGELHGRDTIRQFLATALQAWPDVADSVIEQFSDGDRVIQRFALKGTHTGELMGIPPSGNRFENRGIEIHRFEGGKIAEIWASFDTLLMMQQLGVVPTPERAGA